VNPNELPISYTLTLGEVNTIINALAKQPYEAVADLVNKMRGTALAALQAAEDEARKSQSENAE